MGARAIEVGMPTRITGAVPRIARGLLANVEVFGGLDAAALDHALTLARRRRIRRGEAAFRQGEEATSFYVLVEGRLRVTQTAPSGEQITIRYVSPGEMFGCVAVCGGVGYPGTATATEDSLAIGWSKAATQALMERYPRVAVNALGAMGRRMQEAHVRLREMATEPVGRRIAHTLVRLVAQAGRQGPKGIEIDFPMTRQDLAEMAGTTLHTVSRTLSAWEEAGVVESRRRRVIVRDPAALAQLAEEPAQG